MTTDSGEIRFMAIRLTTLLLFLWIVDCCVAQAAGKDAVHRQFEISRSEVHTLESERLGRTYDLYIRVPPRYGAAENKDRVYPVIYLNDGSYCFQTAAGITDLPMNLGGLEHAILVGISYAKGEKGMASRSRDFTPTSLGPEARYVHGGARDYLAFLREEVIPFVERGYRVDADRRTLVGQSYGALFGAYALLSEPDLFSGYILTSPSFWFDDEVIFDIEKRFEAAADRLDARVYLAVGDMETPSYHGAPHDLVADQKRFAEALRRRGYNGLEIRNEVIEGATHQTTFPIGLTRGLMWLHGGPDPYNGGARWYGN